MPERFPSVLVVLSSADRRGAEVQGSGLVRELRRRGSDVEAVALRPARNGAGLDVPVIGTGSPRSPAMLRQLRRLSANRDVVIGFGSVTLPACASSLMGLRTRFVYRSIGDPRAWTRGAWHRRRTALLYRRADHVVALFADAATAIHQMYGVPGHQISLAPNARNATDFFPPDPRSRARARECLGVPPNALVIAQIGSFGAEKRIPLGIRAAGLVPDAHLLVAGSGAEQAKVEAAARTVGQRVQVLGTRDDVIEVYRAADLVLSTSSTEGMPGVVIEAALCRVPAVVTNVGASAEVVGTGGLVVSESADEEEIAKAITCVADDRERFAQAALDHARARFTWAAAGAAWSAILDRVSRTGP